MHPRLSSLVGLLLLLPLPAAAKDLGGRLGLGFNQQLGGTSALSIRYGLPTGKPTINIQIEGDAGFDVTTDGAGAIFAGGRLLYGVVAEDNMNLFLGGGAGWLHDGTEGILRIQPALGAQFFFYGLENLGFSAELGVNVDLGDATRLTTVGGAPAVAMHYYF